MIRHKPMKHGGRIKSKPRSASEKRRIYGPKGFVEWMHGEPCHHCGCWAGERRSIVVAHVVTGGKGRKADWTQTIPLCETANKQGCHDAQHQCGWSVLGLEHKADRIAAASDYQERWHAYQLSLS